MASSMNNPPTYHQSMVNMFLKCQKQFVFRYIEGIITPPKAAMTVGSSVDAAVTRNLILKKESGQDLPLADALDVYSTDFEVRKKETEWEDEDPDKQKDIGVQCLTAHHTELAPAIQPETVQEKFVIETDAGYNVGGTIDLVEKDGTIADTKTAKSAYQDDAAYRAIQPTLYDYAYKALRGKPAKAFRYDVLIKPTKTLPARTQQVTAKVSESDHAWLFDAVGQMHKSLQAGIALPAPEGAWWCQPSWCAYYSRCKGKK